MPLFIRQAELLVGTPAGEAISIKDLRFEFDITKTSTRSVNRCSLKVYNACDNSISMLEAINNVVILKAGYLDDLGPVTIFVGTITRALTYQDGADILTEIDLADSIIPIRDAKISLSKPPNASAISIMKIIAGNFGLPLKLAKGIEDKQYISGFAFNGRARDAMDRVCRFLSLEWSAQDGEMQVIKKGGVFSESAVVISKDTGMIGYPRREAKTMTEKTAAQQGIKYGQKGVIRTTIDVEEPTSKMKDRSTLEVQGYRVSSLLNAAIYPGAYIKLISRGINGDFFRVEEARYIGDTHGQAWNVDVLLRFPK